MNIINYISGSFSAIDGSIIEPMTQKTLVIPEDTEFDENGESEVDGIIIYSKAHDKSFNGEDTDE